jgi:acetyltransferase-like isoleucine patch superfamily enzyme
LKWRKANRHNFTIANSIFGIDNVVVGQKTYGELNINLGTNPLRTVRIGSFCSIAPDVYFLINPHNYSLFSTWGWQRFEFNEYYYDWEKKLSINVEDDVWIGQGVTILGGVTLHQGCVIGAGAVVSKDVPRYAIFAGGKIIKYRFSPEVCAKLHRIDYARIDDAVIKRIKGWHKIEIAEDNVDNLLKLLPLKVDI